jgi:hypothetical protein
VGWTSGRCRAKADAWAPRRLSLSASRPRRAIPGPRDVARGDWRSLAARRRAVRRDPVGARCVVVGEVPRPPVLGSSGSRASAGGGLGIDGSGARSAGPRHPCREGGEPRPGPRGCGLGRSLSRPCARPRRARCGTRSSTSCRTGRSTFMAHAGSTPGRRRPGSRAGGRRWRAQPRRRSRRPGRGSHESAGGGMDCSTSARGLADGGAVRAADAAYTATTRSADWWTHDRRRGEAGRHG